MGFTENENINKGSSKSDSSSRIREHQKMNQHLKGKDTNNGMDGQNYSKHYTEFPVNEGRGTQGEIVGKIVSIEQLNKTLSDWYNGGRDGHSYGVKRNIDGTVTSRNEDFDCMHGDENGGPEDCHDAHHCHCHPHDPPTCFVAGTIVELEDGSHVKIEDIVVGDKLKGQTSINTVKELDRTTLGNRKLYSINGGEPFVTAEHPFMTNEGWKSIDPDMTISEAKALNHDSFRKEGSVKTLDVNDKLETTEGSKRITKIASVNDDSDTPLYNFELDGDNTYFANNYLVHNKCCFLAGTKIAMADGTEKNIEDVLVGDFVKSWNEKTKDVEDRRVLELQSPIREGYYNLYYGENGRIQLTNEHPLYIKKADGTTNWCSIEPEKTKEYYPHLDFVGQIEKPSYTALTGETGGDSIYTLDGKWEQVKGWEYVEGEVKTYNLWSVENNKTFFANGLLAHNRSCFLAGTKIAMSDGTEKNIEDVIVGDVVRSYNEKTKDVEDREVLEVESPIREGYYKLNFGDNEIIELTNEHPLFIRKPNGTTNWCSIEPEKTKEYYPNLDFVGQIETESYTATGGQVPSDEIYTLDGKWKKVNSWEYVEGPIRTYNLWSVENNKTFYANGLLAHNRCCFVGGTKIQMADGTEINIEDVKVGDLVKSWNESTKEIEDRKVLELQSPVREGYYNLKFVSGRILKLTNEHPLYTKKRNGEMQWCSIEPEKTREYYPHLDFIGQLETPAYTAFGGELKGESVYTIEKKWEEIESWEYVEGPIQTYNLWSVENNKTFYANGLLAHNRSCFLAGTKVAMSDGTEKNIEDVVVGDIVKTFDEKDNTFKDKKVLEVESPVREGYYELNFGDNEVIKLTNEHPLYTKKMDGTIGWSSIEPNKTKEYYPYLEFVTQINEPTYSALTGEVPGDMIFTVDGEWKQVNSWKYVEGPIQTYNLWEIEDTHTFFADGLLAHNRVRPERLPHIVRNQGGIVPPRKKPKRRR